MTDGPTYRGVPLEDIEIEGVLWTDERAEHIRTRTARYDPGETNLEPEWATEAVLDPFAQLRLPSGESHSLIVIGWSPSAGRVLRVFIHPIDMTAGLWAGGSAAKAKDAVADRYWRERRDREGPDD